VKPQYQSLDRIAADKKAAERQLQTIQDTLKRAPQLENTLREAKARLAGVSSDLASGDLYSSLITMIRNFKMNNYHVDIPQFGQLSAETDVNCLAGIPLKQVTMTVNGTAQFQEFGRFLADFENQFPHTRVVNLGVDANAGTIPEQQETISFRMEIITLVSPNAL